MAATYDGGVGLAGLDGVLLGQQRRHRAGVSAATGGGVGGGAVPAVSAAIWALSWLAFGRILSIWAWTKAWIWSREGRRVGLGHRLGPLGASIRSR